MFPVEEAIKARRSIRKYSPRKVSTKLIREILEAARWAPSAHNALPWRFIVLTNRVLKQNLADAMANAWTADMTKDGISAGVSETNAKSSVERFTQAPVLIVACVTMKDMIRYVEESRLNCEHDLAVQSLGAAIENLLLAAHSRGLGACWFCAPIFCKDATRRILRVPEDVEPQALITLGYPIEKPCVPFRKPLESTFYLNGWGKNL
jgi:coenzyme F420-0:L-glutamate ligase/coenzyme F420-1:gamma-L-glutamate ligase